MNWGGRLQAHSQWDNNSESGFDSQMIVLKGGRGAEQSHVIRKHLILTLCWSSFSYPLEIWFSFTPPSNPNPVEIAVSLCDCSVNLSRRATPLFPTLRFFNRCQILFKAEMIHHAAEFTIAMRWEQGLTKPAVMLFSPSDRLPCSSLDCSYNLLLISSFRSPEQYFHQILVLLALLIYVSMVQCELNAMNIHHLTYFTPRPWSPCLFTVYLQPLWWVNITQNFVRLVFFFLSP